MATHAHGPPATTEETPRQRLARLMDERRDELGLEWREIAHLAGITKEGLRTVRNGTAKRTHPRTKRGIERALGWQTGSFDRILAGGDPAPVPGYQPAVGETPVPDAGADLVYQHDARRIFVNIKRFLTPREIKTLHDHFDCLREVAYHANASIGDVIIVAKLATPGELAPTIGAVTRRDPVIAEIEDDPRLPDNVKQKIVDAYRRLREEIAESLNK